MSRYDFYYTRLSQSFLKSIYVNWKTIPLKVYITTFVFSVSHLLTCKKISFGNDFKNISLGIFFFCIKGNMSLDRWNTSVTKMIICSLKMVYHTTYFNTLETAPKTGSKIITRLAKLFCTALTSVILYFTYVDKFTGICISLNIKYI